jgi:hypothetical protein
MMHRQSFTKLYDTTLHNMGQEGPVIHAGEEVGLLIAAGWE